MGNNQHTNHTGQRTDCSPQNGLPRKEVIQPHLPVRLPCYDFVPIANPTFDHSPRHVTKVGNTRSPWPNRFAGGSGRSTGSTREGPAGGGASDGTGGENRGKAAESRDRSDQRAAAIYDRSKRDVLEADFRALGRLLGNEPIEPLRGAE